MYGLIAALILIIIFVNYWRRGRYRLPPGPWGLPFIGVAFRLDPSGPHKTFTDWSHHFGDVFSIKLYGEDFIVLNSFDTIYKALVTEGDDFGGRTRVFRFEVMYDFSDGIIHTSYSKKWLFRKKLAMQTLKMYGDELLVLEKISLDVIGDVLEELATAAENAQPIDIASIMQNTTLGVITSILYGKTLDSESFRLLANHFDNLQAVIDRTPSGFAIDTLPVLRHFPLQKKYQRAVEVKEMLKRVYMKEIKDARERYEPGHPRCFNQGLFEYQQNNNGKPGCEFDLTEDDLYCINVDMIQAGTVTTSVNLSAMIAILVNHPHIQEKMASEIQQVIGERQPRLADRINMDFCEAVILETLRYHTMLPLNVVHTTTRDITLDGYDIPKGINVFFNLWKLNHDPAYWDKPWMFEPERFLDQDGKLITVDHPKRKRLIAFGAGRRVCIGRSLARNRLFLIITSMIQHFHFLPESYSKKPKHDPRDYVNGFNIFPKPYKVIAKHRI